MLKCEEDLQAGRVSVAATTTVFMTFLTELCCEHNPTDVYEAHKQLDDDLELIRKIKRLGRAGKIRWITNSIAKYYGTIRIARAMILVDDLKAVQLRVHKEAEGDV